MLLLKTLIVHLYPEHKKGKVLQKIKLKSTYATFKTTTLTINKTATKTITNTTTNSTKNTTIKTTTNTIN